MTKGNSIVFGIDPGSKFTGWGVVASANDMFEYLASGVIDVHNTKDLPARFHAIYVQISALIMKYKPDIVAIEDTFAHKYFKASLVLAQVQALCILAAHQTGCKVELVQSKSVKKIITGNGNAEKMFVNQAMTLLIPNISFDTLDASDALAIALSVSLNNQSVLKYA